MVCLKSLLLFTTAASSATLSQVNQDVTNIDNNVKSLIITTSAYSGGIIAVLPLLGDLTKVYIALASGVKDSDLLPPAIVSVADAYTLINHVNETLAVDNPIAVKTLESKKKYFQEEGLDGVIVVALGLLKVGHDSFSANVLARCPKEATADAKTVIEIIDVALQSGIDSFTAAN